MEYPGGTGTHLQKNQRKIREQDQEILLQLADRENELRVGDLPGTFIAGFQLGMGIAGGLEPYSFEDAEEKQATEWVKTGRPHVKD